MTKLNLKPNSPELNRIMSNKLLFSWYAKMIMEDYELEMNRFKYLAMFTNPEAYKQVENGKSNDNVVKNNLLVNGEMNRERAQILNDELNIKLGTTKNQTDGIDIL